MALMTVILDREEQITIDDALDSEITRLRNDIKKYGWQSGGNYVQECKRRLEQTEALKERLRSHWPEE